ncbi:MAG: glycosyltransferase family 2 protein [Cyanobacteriota bacterium]
MAKWSTSGQVSVIIPVFNRERLLREAIMSVLLQSYKSIEIIIVNDGSTDNTERTAEELAKKWPKTINVISQANAGPGRARELGTQLASGDFIQYLDSDDLLLATKLESQVKALLKNPESSIAYGISYQEDYSFHPPLLSGPLRLTGDEIPHLFPKLLNERWWTTSCPLYRRQLINRIGPWKDLINEEDWEFDGRAGRLDTSLVWVNEGMSIRRINLNSDHLSFGGCTNVKKLSHRILAKQLLFEYALANGMKRTDYEMKLFARECFLLSRQSGIIGLEKQSRIMFRLSRRAATEFRRYGIDYIIYALLASCFGWISASRLASRLKDMLR